MVKVTINTSAGEAEYDTDDISKVAIRSGQFPKRPDQCNHECPILTVMPPRCSQCGQKMKLMPTHIPDYD